jgi:hypothetical protein
MPKMTKRQFEELFREEVLPSLVERYEQDDIPDKPARREAWNNTVDAYIRDGALPEAAGNWTHPRWLETWRPPQRHHASARKKSPAQLEREIAEALGRGTAGFKIGDVVQFRWEPGTGGVIRRLAPDGSASVATARGERNLPIDAIRHVRKEHEDRVRRAVGATTHATKRAAKTQIMWVVQGNYGHGHGWEDVTAEENRKEAKERLREYRENERGVPFRAIRRRERIAP